MSFDAFDSLDLIEQLESYVERNRPQPELRKQLDLGYEIVDQSVILTEIRPLWREPETMKSYGYAKATYVKRQDEWKVYWMRSDLNWHRYEPTPSVKKLSQFIKLVEEDKHHCFKG